LETSRSEEPKLLYWASSTLAFAPASNLLEARPYTANT
jgi:hypothetical protein